MEPTAALPLAWLLSRPALPEEGEIVLLLSGSGLRSGRLLFSAP
ncbi:MAG: hypothetical protein Q9Q13_01780 [Acidobacteriota bacterium]|nr:hypothetical protein [Acidobacteriota bacterium]